MISHELYRHLYLKLNLKLEIRFATHFCDVASSTTYLLSEQERSFLVRALYIVLNHNTTVCIIGLLHRAVLNHGHEWSVPWPGGLSNFETVNGGTEPVLVPLDFIRRLIDFPGQGNQSTRIVVCKIHYADIHS